MTPERNTLCFSVVTFLEDGTEGEEHVVLVIFFGRRADSSTLPQAVAMLSSHFPRHDEATHEKIVHIFGGEKKERAGHKNQSS
jgi:hypothetical protein